MIIFWPFSFQFNCLNLTILYPSQSLHIFSPSLGSSFPVLCTAGSFLFFSSQFNVMFSETPSLMPCLCTLTLPLCPSESLHIVLLISFIALIKIQITLCNYLLIYYPSLPLTVKLHQGRDPAYLFLCPGQIAYVQKDAE